MSLLRATALLAALFLMAGCGRKSASPPASEKPTPPKPAAPLPSADEKALRQLGANVFTAFAKGDVAAFRALTVAALPASDLKTALRTVREKEARQFITRVETIPADQRNALQLDTLRLSKAFLTNPKTAFGNEWPTLKPVIDALGNTQLEFFQNHTTHNAPMDWAEASRPSMVISINPQTDAILPEARVNIVFSAGNKSFRLQLSNCAKLPGHSWRVAEELRFIDLTAEATTEKDWGTDLPAALKLAQAGNKRVLIEFSGSDWCPLCIALHDRVLTQPTFHDWAAQKLVLVRADFPRHTSPPHAQADANKLLLRKYAVNGFPTLLLLDAAGKELHRIEGYKNESATKWVAELKQKLNSNDE